MRDFEIYTRIAFAIDVKIAGVAQPVRASLREQTSRKGRNLTSSSEGSAVWMQFARVSRLYLSFLPLVPSFSSLVPDVRNEAHLVARARPMARRYGGRGHAQRPIAPRVTQLSARPRPTPDRTAPRMTRSARLADTPRRQSLLVRAWGECISLARQRERRNGPLIRRLAKPSALVQRDPEHDRADSAESPLAETYRIRCASNGICARASTSPESRLRPLHRAQSVLFLRRRVPRPSFAPRSARRRVNRVKSSPRRSSRVEYFREYLPAIVKRSPKIGLFAGSRGHSVLGIGADYRLPGTPPVLGTRMWRCNGRGGLSLSPCHFVERRAGGGGRERETYALVTRTDRRR